MPVLLLQVTEFCTYGSLFDFLHTTDLVVRESESEQQSQSLHRSSQTGARESHPSTSDASSTFSYDGNMRFSATSNNNDASVVATPSGSPTHSRKPSGLSGATLYSNSSGKVSMYSSGNNSTTELLKGNPDNTKILGIAGRAKSSSYTPIAESTADGVETKNSNDDEDVVHNIIHKHSARFNTPPEHPISTKAELRNVLQATDSPTKDANEDIELGGEPPGKVRSMTSLGPILPTDISSAGHRTHSNSYNQRSNHSVLRDTLLISARSSDNSHSDQSTDHLLSSYLDPKQTGNPEVSDVASRLADAMHYLSGVQLSGRHSVGDGADNRSMRQVKVSIDLYHVK